MEKSTRGMINGLIGVIIFAGSLPATRLAVIDFRPLFLTCTRASIAALAGGVVLMLLAAQRPRGRQLPSLMVIALGVVVGFPLLTALALEQISSAQSLVFMGLLPLCTSLFGVLRMGERPRPVFWLFSLLGAALVIGYAVRSSAALPLSGSLLMLAAIAVCGLGYAEGARLSHQLGGWQVICWALILALPVMLPLAWLTQPPSYSQQGLPAWCGLLYVSLFSMLIGFVFWYRGLMQGGIAAVSQLQLLQPFFGLGLAALVLHETVSPMMLAVSVGAIVCVAGAKKFAR